MYIFILGFIILVLIIYGLVGRCNGDTGRRVNAPLPEIIQEEDDALDRLDKLTTIGSNIYGPNEQYQMEKIKLLEDTYTGYNRVITDEDYGGAEPEFIFQRAEGFRDNAREIYNVDFRQYPALPTKQKKQLNVQIHRAEKTTGTKKEKIETYLKNVKTHTNDTQNVHDHVLCKDLKSTYDAIVDGATKCTSFDRYGDIIEVIGKHVKADKALCIAETMACGLNIVAIGDNEKNILVNTWNRSYHPCNVSKGGDNGAKIREAIIDQLADCYNDSGSIVCGNGRSARVISALSTIDGEGLGNTMTGEAYRNEAFNLAQVSLKRNIKAFAASGDADDRRFAETFTNPNADINEDNPGIQDAKDKFKKLILQDVDAYLKENANNIQESVRGEIIAGLDL